MDIAKHQRQEIVQNAFNMAVGRNPDRPKGAVYHSDRGCQYTAKKTKELVEQNGFRKSMSRPGTPSDNQPIESFWKTLECGSFLLPELIALSTVYYESQNYRKEVDILEEAYSISCVSNGNEHNDTLKILSFLFIAYDNAGDHDVAVELGERAYEQFLCVYGPDNENTIIVKENLDRIKGNL